MESVVYVGMDVDKEKLAVSVLHGYEAQPRLERIVRNRADPISAFFSELAEKHDRVLACYEAGACGFELHRRLTKLSVGCLVVAPVSLPRKPRDRIKTDRRDARKLALGLRNGDLTPVFVPTRQDESVRDYLKLYEDAKSDLKKAKQRLLHFLLRHEIRYDGGTNWTGKHRAWLRSLVFDSPTAQDTFNEYVAEASRLEEKRARLAARVEAIAEDPEYSSAVNILRAFRGIGTLTALSFVVEVGDYRRFSLAEEFMAFLGLVPSERSSGDKRRVGGITKAGNSHLRKLLVEAAWHARSYRPGAKSRNRSRATLPPEVLQYADRAGRRLSKKFWRMLHAGRPPQVAATAVARELAGFIWGAMIGDTA